MCGLYFLLQIIEVVYAKVARLQADILSVLMTGATIRRHSDNTRATVVPESLLSIDGPYAQEAQSMYKSWLLTLSESYNKPTQYQLAESIISAQTAMLDSAVEALEQCPAGVAVSPAFMSNYYAAVSDTDVLAQSLLAGYFGGGPFIAGQYDAVWRWGLLMWLALTWGSDRVDEIKSK